MARQTTKKTTKKAATKRSTRKSTKATKRARPPAKRVAKRTSTKAAKKRPPSKAKKTATTKATKSATPNSAAKSAAAPAIAAVHKTPASSTRTVAEIFDTMEYGPAPESDKFANEWLKGKKRKFKHYIGGEWRTPSEYFAVQNPARQEQLGEVGQGTQKDVDAAVEAAAAAQPAWEALGGHGRAKYLYAIARHVQKHHRLMAVLESLDNGKTIRESRDIDVPLVARHFYHHAGWAQLMEDEMSDFAPLGVVGQVIPWNFPVLMLAWKIAPALAMGNCVVLKPAEYTPLTALLFAEICEEVGLPPGVVNIVTGDGRTGAMIVDHPAIAKIAFTGSTGVGRIIRNATAGTGKTVSMELGGKSPFIVYEDADLDSVVEGVVDAIWFNQGQVCCAGSRILVQETVADKLLEKLKARMQHFRIGEPLDKAVDMGPIVSRSQLDQITRLVKQGGDEGATVWQPQDCAPVGGLFFPPTLLSDVHPASTVAQEEIFGPVVVYMTFRTPSEAIKLANNTRYGLAASIWSENINLCLETAPKIKAGVIWVNCTNMFDAAAGFGGYRESGYGREGGKEGLYEYCKPRWLLEAKKKKKKKDKGKDKKPPALKEAPGAADDRIDRTAKLYIGGRQKRPDGAYSLRIDDAWGRPLGEAGRGNRKDIRDAVEAAHGSRGWGTGTAHLRAQVLYYCAENLASRHDEFVRRLHLMVGSEKAARREVDTSIDRLFTYAAWADKYDGAVHATPHRNVTVAMHEAIGVMGIVCPDENPLLAFVSTVAPAIAMGNSVVVVPSERSPLAATDFYQILETSDVPGGAVNIVTGVRSEMVPTLAGHGDVEQLWYFGPQEGNEEIERLSTANMKRTWCHYGVPRDWTDRVQGAGREFLREATQVKNIWIPYGE